MKQPSYGEGPGRREELARLRKSEARLRAILQQASDGIVTASEEGVIESFNPAAERIFGWSAEEIVGQPLSLLMSEPDRGEHRGYIERYLRTGEAHVIGTTVLVEARRKDGAVFPMELSVSEVRFEEGRFFLGILRDASASQSAQEALADSTERLQTVLNAATELAIITTDPKGTITLFNRGAERMLGFTAQEVVGEASPLIFHRADEVEACGRSLNLPAGDQIQGFAVFEEWARGGRRGEREWTWLRKDGHRLLVLCTITPLYDAKGLPAGYLWIGRDVTQIRRQEMELRDSEERYRSIIGALREGVVLLGDDGRILACNASAERILGLAPGQLEGLSSLDSMWQTLHEDGSPFPVERHPATLTLKTGIPLSEVVMGVHRPDGSLAWIAINSRPMVRSPGGSPYAVVVSFTDITERKNQEKALKESEERFRTLATASPVGVFQTDAEGQCLYTNPRWCEITGLTREASLGVGWIRAVHPDDQDDLLIAWRRALLWGKELVHEFRFRHPGGEVRWVLARAAAVRSEGNSIRGYVGTAEDITDRKRAEEALRDSEARTRAIIEQLLGGLITITEEGIIESANPSAQRMFGYTEEELVGRHLSLLLPETAGEDPKEFLRRAHRQSIGRVTEWEARRRSGAVFPVEVSLFEFQTPQGRRFAGDVRDLTQLKEVERLKREFVSTVSHELRTPLTSIRGSLGLLAGGAAGPLPEKAGELVSIALKNSERLILLINDILDLEKIESGRMDFTIQTVDVMTSVELALATNEAYASQFGVRLALVKAAPGCQILADPNRLAQVMANLLSNACKFSPPDGTVDVSVEEVQGMVRISVTDHGPGIPEQFRDRIFQRFAQADASDDRKKGGTGLGLNISKAIVEHMGGRIGFDTETGRGTTFYFDLPAAGSSGLGSLMPDQGGRPVLICVKDVETGRILQETLAQEGYAVESARTLWEARGRIERLPFGALLLSPELPDGDGLTFVRNLRASDAGRSLPVVMISEARPGPNEPLAGEALLVLDWLSPPLDRVRLASAIHQAARLGRTKERPRILHVEDDPDVVRVLAVVLAGEAGVASARTLEEARRLLAEERFDAVILDLDLPDGTGLDLLPELKARDGRTLPVIIFSAAELPRELARRVGAALVKSRSTNQDLVAAVHALLRGGGRAAGNGQE
ncbi:MAG: PAS domain S-box protein [Acidobacteriota bacterium]